MCGASIYINMANSSEHAPPLPTFNNSVCSRCQYWNKWKAERLWNKISDIKSVADEWLENYQRVAALGLPTPAAERVAFYLGLKHFS